MFSYLNITMHYGKEEDNGALDRSYMAMLCSHIYDISSFNDTFSWYSMYMHFPDIAMLCSHIYLHLGFSQISRQGRKENGNMI